jgi:hypothetical protein
MNKINRIIAMTSLLALMTALTAAQYGSNENTLAYAYIQNENEQSDGDASTTVPNNDPFLIVLPCCDYMLPDIGSPLN